MSLLELVLVAIGLSMDAFAVAVCQGLSMKKVTMKKALIVGLYFGFFQALMPLIGYLVGSRFADVIVEYDHWLAFVLLGIIGIKMIIESRSEECEVIEETTLDMKSMLPLAIATSIDALAAGVTFAFVQVNIVSAVSLIGIITLVLSMVGVMMGSAFGKTLKNKAELFGGVVLVLIGLKILLEHTGILVI